VDADRRCGTTRGHRANHQPGHNRPEPIKEATSHPIHPNALRDSNPVRHNATQLRIGCRRTDRSIVAYRGRMHRDTIAREPCPPALVVVLDSPGFLRRSLATNVVRLLTNSALSLPDISHVEIHHDKANQASAGAPKAWVRAGR
jgi:hypothetical protein